MEGVKKMKGRSQNPLAKEYEKQTYDSVVRHTGPRTHKRTQSVRVEQKYNGHMCENSCFHNHLY